MNAPQKHMQDNMTYPTTTRPYVGRLAVAALAGLTLLAAAPTAPADCNCDLVWFIDQDEMCGLTADCTVWYLIILPGGQLYTNQYTLTVTCDSGLFIADGARLIVNNGAGRVVLSGGGSSAVFGTIELQSSYSTLSIVNNNLTLTGSGRVEGQDSNALITVASDLTLTNEIDIAGALQIRAGSATFDNDGLVSADRDNGEGDGTLTCYSGTFRGDYTDPNEGVYKVHGGKMRFCVGVDDTGMDARFIITEGGGTLYIDENIITTDEYEQYGGKIDVAPGKVFQATSS